MSRVPRIVYPAFRINYPLKYNVWIKPMRTAVSISVRLKLLLETILALTILFVKLLKLILKENTENLNRAQHSSRFVV